MATATSELLDLLPDAVMRCEIVGQGGESVVTSWNRGAEKLYGFRASEALGRAPRALLGVEYDEPRESIAATLLRGAGEWDGPQLHHAADGRELPVQCRTVTERDPEGQAVSFLVVCRDRTVERRVARENASFEAMLGLALDAILARDTEGLITFWNQGAESMLAYTAEEALGRKVSELLATEYPLPLRQIEQIVTRDGRWEGDLVQRAKDGGRVVVQSRWAAEYDRAGDVISILEVNRDITGRLEAEAEAERGRLQVQVQRVRRLESLGQLAGGVAHDFNNLLAVILNYTAFVAEELTELDGPVADDARHAQMAADLGEVREAAHRATRLTQQLLAFARHDTVEPVLISVNEVITGLQELIRRTLGGHVRLSFALADDLPMTLIDTGQLESLVINLAVNARDAMPRGGNLVVRTKVVDTDTIIPDMRPRLALGMYVQLEVIDDGDGMTAEVARHALEPFFTTKIHAGGTGLGLATVQEVAARAGGKVNITSAPGRGTTISVLLPVSERV